MPRGLLVFLAVALAILFGFQHFIYFSTTRLLGINGRAGRRVVAAALLFLLVGAVASVFLQRRVDTVLARAVVGTFQLSLGLGLTLGVAFLLAWAFLGCARIWNPRLPGEPLGWNAIVLAALFSAYGVWAATHPRVARVTVRMRDLPAEWRGRTIAQISDLHLGFSVGRSFAERVVEMVNAERPAAVVITGDLFDGGDAGLDGLAGALNGLILPWGSTSSRATTRPIWAWREWKRRCAGPGCVC